MHIITHEHMLDGELVYLCFVRQQGFHRWVLAHWSVWGKNGWSSEAYVIGIPMDVIMICVRSWIHVSLLLEREGSRRGFCRWRKQCGEVAGKLTVALKH